MATNHIHLVMGFIQELMDLAMAQQLIDIGRREHATNQFVQLTLDRQQTLLLEKKSKIEDEMFEISRSN